jgi:hypothetical protein
VARDRGKGLAACDVPLGTLASALIGSGLDVLTVIRRLGHGSPAVTLTTYAHLFSKTDVAAGGPT